jgi:thioredoxin reductase (NADPH)
MRFSKIIIVGCGPAGMACAIQLKRMGLYPVVIEKKKPGGLLFNANLVENYPGFPGGISGPELANRMIRQFKGYNITLLNDEVILAISASGIFTLNCTSGYYQCNVLVIATGTSPVIPESCPDKLVTEGLVHFDITELRQVTGKTIGIIGGGDAAFDYSLTMAENGNEVIIFNRGDQVRALNILQEKVFINNKIKYLANTDLESLEILPGKGLSAICQSAFSKSKYSLDYLIFATGRKPADYIFDESIRNNMQDLTNKRRLYLVGDIKNGHYRQVSVAVGDGVKAAMEIFQDESNQ